MAEARTAIERVLSTVKTKRPSMSEIEAARTSQSLGPFASKMMRMTLTVRIALTRIPHPRGAAHASIDQELPLMSLFPRKLLSLRRLRPRSRSQDSTVSLLNLDHDLEALPRVDQ